MGQVYLIKPLEKKSVQWVVEMYRKNSDDTISWFTLNETYRWGQGFIEGELDCNLPYLEDRVAYARTDCGWGAEFDDSISIDWEFSNDISESEQEEIKQSYLEGGGGWLFDGDHEWEVEDDTVMIYAPYQVSLCNESGTIIDENVKLSPRPTLHVF